MNAKCAELIWFEGGLECGEDRGKVCIVTRALYGLKSAGFSRMSALAGTLRDMKFVSSKADPDVWIREAVCENGYEYYEMVLVYTDGILAVSHQAKA